MENDRNLYTGLNLYQRKCRDDLINFYGEKLGVEAYAAIKKARIGTIYRKNGGPLVKVIDTEEAEVIHKKEKEIGLIKE